MNIDAAIKHIDGAISEMEKELYNFDTVAIPRYECDKDILNRMRDDLIKLEAIKTKHDKGEDITTEELSAVPKAFR